MLVSSIPPALRRLVADRAKRLCEYCLIHEEDTFLGCEVDHIISRKHGGQTEASNLAYACVFCNRYKGTDLGSLIVDSREIVRFFNPRFDRWYEHFGLEGLEIVPRTEIGEVTGRILRFNVRERLLEREALGEIGLYPRRAARKLMIGLARGPKR
jgi:hypothetical protein